MTSGAKLSAKKRKNKGEGERQAAHWLWLGRLKVAYTRVCLSEGKLRHFFLFFSFMTPKLVKQI
jgi:hypothetical protein